MKEMRTALRIPLLENNKIEKVFLIIHSNFMLVSTVSCSFYVYLYLMFRFHFHFIFFTITFKNDDTQGFVFLQTIRNPYLHLYKTFNTSCIF